MKKPTGTTALCNPFDLQHAEPAAELDVDEDMAPAAQFGMMQREDRIANNLEEIQQEEEIIFIDDRWRNGFKASQDLRHVLPGSSDEEPSRPLDLSDNYINQTGCFAQETLDAQNEQDLAELEENGVQLDDKDEVQHEEMLEKEQ